MRNFVFFKTVALMPQKAENIGIPYTRHVVLDAEGKLKHTSGVASLVTHAELMSKEPKREQSHSNMAKPKSIDGMIVASVELMLLVHKLGRFATVPKSNELHSRNHEALDGVKDGQDEMANQISKFQRFSAPRDQTCLSLLISWDYVPK